MEDQRRSAQIKPASTLLFPHQVEDVEVKFLPLHQSCGGRMGSFWAPVISMARDRLKVEVFRRVWFASLIEHLFMVIHGVPSSLCIQMFSFFVLRHCPLDSKAGAGNHWSIIMISCCKGTVEGHQLSIALDVSQAMLKPQPAVKEGKILGGIYLVDNTTNMVEEFGKYQQ